MSGAAVAAPAPGRWQVTVRRPVQRADKDGKKYTEEEWVDGECKACDGSGYIHVPGD